MHAIVELVDGGVAAVWTCATRPDTLRLATRLATECGAAGVADRIDARVLGVGRLPNRER